MPALRAIQHAAGVGQPVVLRRQHCGDVGHPRNFRRHCEARECGGIALLSARNVQAGTADGAAFQACGDPVAHGHLGGRRQERLVDLAVGLHAGLQTGGKFGRDLRGTAVHDVVGDDERFPDGDTVEAFGRVHDGGGASFAYVVVQLLQVLAHCLGGEFGGGAEFGEALVEIGVGVREDVESGHGW